MIKAAPSILAADPLRLGDEAERMIRAGCDWLHVDVMDGHFVPNLSYGPSLVKALSSISTVPLDVHLMLSKPARYLEKFAAAGATGMTVHAEIDGGAEEALRIIRSLGKRAGLALKPATPVQAIQPLLKLCDLVLVMTVEPGFGGQKFMANMVEKIRQLRELGYQGLIEADGGIRLDNLGLMSDAGLDVAVMGTALFRAADPKADIHRIHQGEFGE